MSDQDIIFTLHLIALGMGFVVGYVYGRFRVRNKK